MQLDVQRRFSTKIWAGRSVPQHIPLWQQIRSPRTPLLLDYFRTFGMQRNGWYENTPGSPMRKEGLTSFCLPREEVTTTAELFGSLLGRI